MKLRRCYRRGQVVHHSSASSRTDSQHAGSWLRCNGALRDDTVMCLLTSRQLWYRTRSTGVVVVQSRKAARQRRAKTLQFEASVTSRRRNVVGHVIREAAVIDNHSRRCWWSDCCSSCRWSYRCRKWWNHQLRLFRAPSISPVTL